MGELEACQWLIERGRPAVAWARPHDLGLRSLSTEANRDLAQGNRPKVVPKTSVDRRGSGQFGDSKAFCRG